MSAPIRATGPLLTILELFLDTWQEREPLHGWRIMREARLAGPTVYRALDQLEDRGWITGEWDREEARPGQPRRRLYRLTPNGAEAIRELVVDTASARNRYRRPSSRPGFAQLAWALTLRTG